MSETARVNRRFAILGLSTLMSAAACAEPSTPSSAAAALPTSPGAAPAPGTAVNDAGEYPPPDAFGDEPSPASSLGSWNPAVDGGSTIDLDGGGLDVQTITTTVGPIAVAPGTETVVCITIRLPNADAAYVPRMTVQLAPGSHHLVIYRSSATTESPTPTPCTTFQGILSLSAVPLMISEKPSDDLTFPQGVALKIAPQQMIELEAHYINVGSNTLQGMGTVHFETIPATTPNVVESDFGFYGTFNVDLNPGVDTVGPIFVAGKAGTHAFALTTHQHRLGKEFKVWAATSAMDTNHPPIADTTDWANPPLYRLNPQLDFDGQNGLAYQCTWNNTTGQVVTFGESAQQEMCFFWIYYYPSQGFDLRFQ